MSYHPIFQAIEGKEDLDSFSALEFGRAEFIIDASTWLGPTKYLTFKPNLSFGIFTDTAGQVTYAVDVLEYIESLIELDGLGTLVLCANDWTSVDARTLASALGLVSNINRGPYGAARSVGVLLIILAGDLAKPENERKVGNGNK